MSLKKDLNLQRSEIIIIDDFKYLIYSLKNKSVELLPVDKILKGDNISIIPKIEAEYNFLKNHIKTDPYELLCLLNEKHPLIRQAMDNFFEDEEKRSWKNQKHKI